jgi:hypothetical protein
MLLKNNIAGPKQKVAEAIIIELFVLVGLFG